MWGSNTYTNPVDGTLTGDTDKVSAGSMLASMFPGGFRSGTSTMTIAQFSTDYQLEKKLDVSL